jgi:hypothetical protein
MAAQLHDVFPGVGPPATRRRTTAPITTSATAFTTTP